MRPGRARSGQACPSVEGLAAPEERGEHGVIRTTTPRHGWLLAGFLLLSWNPGAAEVARDKLVLAHYMAWYASREISGQWGWHWTMGRFNPDAVRADGRRQMAAHDEPLLGLYDSSDPHLLESHVLLLKLAGLDGVVVDWYGISNFNDFGLIHGNTQALIPFLKRAGLRFAICYEDQSIGHRVRGQQLPPERALQAGKDDLHWLERHWFADEAYVKLRERPLLLVFGPQHFPGKDWAAMSQSLKVAPVLFALPHLAEAAGVEGIFGWPPVSGGKTRTPEEWGKDLEELTLRKETLMPVAFPGFRDIYQEAGLHASYGFIDAREGQTLAETLDMAWKSQSPWMQIATWNDHGEGTVVEPTRDLGYRHLEFIQGTLRKRRGEGFAPEDLRLPVLLYGLRRRCGADQALRTALDEAAASLFAGKCEEARRGLQAVSAQLPADAVRE